VVQVDVLVATSHSHARMEKLPRSRSPGLGTLGGSNKSRGTDGGLTLSLSGSPTRWGVSLDRWGAAAVFCPTSQILSGGAKSTAYAYRCDERVGGSASAEDRPRRVACRASQPDKISVRFLRAFAAARAALRKMCMWWRGPHHAGSGAKLRARQVRTAVAQIDAVARSMTFPLPMQNEIDSQLRGPRVRGAARGTLAASSSSHTLQPTRR
jgi:hypothetical protein